MNTESAESGNRSPRVKRRRTPWLWPLVAGGLLWLVFFQGLPARMTHSIPFSAYHTGVQAIGMPVPGDHLQLLYHFWLTREKLTGRTPLLYNVYEFNTGDDAERREVDPGYVPFSLVYAAVTEIGGSHALGWNLSQLAAVLVAFVFLFLLARRYTDSRLTALLAALLAASLPYQWKNLAGGSPTGFGMAFVPAVALGMDWAVRDGRARGGCLAGVALLFCYTSDLHCLAFACLLIPAWGIVAWLSRTDGPRPTRANLRAVARGLWPTVVAGVLVAGVARMLSSFYAATDVAGGRSALDVLRNSPSKRAMFGFVIRGVDLHFRVGFVIIGAILLAVGAAALWAWMRRREDGEAAGGDRLRTPRPFQVSVVLLAGVCLVLLLGMGMNGPFDGLAIRLMRAWVPPYRMIRQPVKVFCLLPTLLAPLFAIGFAAGRACLSTAVGRRHMRSLHHDLAVAGGGVLAAVLAVAGVVETARALRLGVCRLPESNAVYAAIVADAAARGRVPRVLALPIWPGDSAWSSLYEYNTMLYRVRMMNGYAAVCTDAYLRDVYRALESVTQGRLTDSQAAMLRWRGVTTVVLYPNAFPEQVSPFPVGLTIRRLAGHPHLDLLAAGEQLAFVLRDAPATGSDPALWLAPSDWMSPARRWSSHDPSAAPIDSRVAKAWLRSPVVWTPDLTWMVRVRGAGDVAAVRVRAVSDADPGGARVTLASAVSTIETVGGSGDVRWVSVKPGAWPEQWAQAGLELTASAGAEVLDVLLAAGGLPLGRDSVTLPATACFHAGVPDVSDGRVHGVRFRAGVDPADEILYGFHLPLDPGRWRVWIEGDYPDDADAGWLRVLIGGEEVASGRVRAGASPVVFSTNDLAPVSVRFRYAGTVDMRVRAVRFERDDEP